MHPLSAFVFRCLASVVFILAKSKISRLQLVSEAEQAGLSHTWSQTPEDIRDEHGRVTCRKVVTDWLTCYAYTLTSRGDNGRDMRNFHNQINLSVIKGAVTRGLRSLTTSVRPV